MSSGLFKNDTYKLCVTKSYIQVVCHYVGGKLYLRTENISVCS